jgi:hypothetical protein
VSTPPGASAKTRNISVEITPATTLPCGTRAAGQSVSQSDVRIKLKWGGRGLTPVRARSKHAPLLRGSSAIPIDYSGVVTRVLYLVFGPTQHAASFHTGHRAGGQSGRPTVTVISKS